MLESASAGWESCEAMTTDHSPEARLERALASLRGLSVGMRSARSSSCR